MPAQQRPASLALVLWSAVLLFYVYAASFPLTVESQSILAWGLVGLLFVIQSQYDYIEDHLKESLRLFRLVVIFLAALVTLRY